MSHLHLVAAVDPARTEPVVGATEPLLAAAEPTDDRPRVSLRLLMAASGRCSCDTCLLAYRAGDKSAGIIGLPSRRPRLVAVR